MAIYGFRDSRGNQTFSSSKEDLTHVVLFKDGRIAAKCSSLELAKKARAKDERLYGLQGMTIVPLDMPKDLDEKFSCLAPELLKSLITLTELCDLKYGNLDAEIFAEIERARALIAKTTE